ncbi:ABC transporter permease [Candidatus Parcubacteria bacterium]|nr:ABC transporter permease [Candidatus Parcubacteria bacterium]
MLRLNNTFFNPLIFIGPILFLIIWFLVVYFEIVNPVLFPSPARVIVSISEMVFTGEIFFDIFSTLYRASTGYMLGIFFGTILGITAGIFVSFHKSIEFLIDFGRSIPVITLYPLFMVLFGVGDISRMAIAAYSTGIIVLINTLYGVKNVRATRKMVLKLRKCGFFKILKWVIFPEALPQIIVGYRIGISWAYLLVIVTEMFISAPTGLGVRIIDSYTSYETGILYGTILIAGTIGYLLNKFFVLAEQKIVHWADK